MVFRKQCKVRLNFWSSYPFWEGGKAQMRKTAYKEYNPYKVLV